MFSLVMWRALSPVPFPVPLLILWVVTPTDRSLVGGGGREDRTIRRRGFFAMIATLWVRMHNDSVPLSARHCLYVVGRAPWVIGCHSQVLAMRS